MNKYIVTLPVECWVTIEIDSHYDLNKIQVIERAIKRYNDEEEPVNFTDSLEIGQVNLDAACMVYDNKNNIVN